MRARDAVLRQLRFGPQTAAGMAGALGWSREKVSRALYQLHMFGQARRVSGMPKHWRGCNIEEENVPTERKSCCACHAAKPVQPGDVVLGELTGAQQRNHETIHEGIHELQALNKKVQRLKEELEAKRLLMWRELEDSCERAETATERNRCLYVRLGDGGKLVLCEGPLEAGGSMPFRLQGLMEMLGGLGLPSGGG